MIDVNLEKLLEAGAHFGHQSKRWNPKMAEYLYGVRDGVHVFDLIKTKESLVEALNVLSTTAKENKLILLVGTKKQIKEKIAELGEKLGIPYISERWLGGTLTNFDQIGASVKKLTTMKEKMGNGEYANLTKKERLLITRDIEKLQRTVGGLLKLIKKPDVIFVVDTHREVSCIREAQRLGITTVGITDSNADPEAVNYPIPMNDDAVKALEYVLSLVEEAIEEGKNPKSPTSTTSKAKTKKKVVKKEKDGKN